MPVAVAHVGCIPDGAVGHGLCGRGGRRPGTTKAAVVMLHMGTGAACVGQGKGGMPAHPRKATHHTTARERFAVPIRQDRRKRGG